MQCPKLFYYKTILGLTTPQTAATAKGTLAHHAFERIFDHERGTRTRETATSYVRPAWKMMTDPLAERSSVEPGSPEERLRETNNCFRDLHEKDSTSEQRMLSDAQAYRDLFEPESDAEEQFLKEAEIAVTRWFGMENPEKFDPHERELYVMAQVAGVTVHGYIDRLDRIVSPDGSEKWYISDFKTGKKPSERFADEAFFQLEVYALCVEARLGFRPHQLRLIYVNEGTKDGILARKVTEEMLEKTRSKIKSVWSGIEKAARSGVWAPRKQVLCDWCHFKNVCPAFVEGAEALIPEEIARRAGVTFTD